eukprot:TRINITY_DN30888_c0_g1_i1.p1 TRINITY_DN30888_c0_g1~~TRINITY_DN30888_c0_g1_i1.p1  ORF type:complete len:559 (+),score=93.91 TRINITY_DN30888_c0_g1_i1:51-1727(+)
MSECVRVDDDPSLVDETARLLALQWPSQSFLTRRKELQAHCRSERRCELPCHLVIVADGHVMAHCRLQPACENGDGFSAAITSVVVQPTLRGRGIGRELMNHAERVARTAGFGYLYLWTHDAMGFYTSCGYHDCEKVSLLRPALAALGSAAVDKLEAMLSKRCSDGGGGASEANVRSDSVWMRKRLLETTTNSLPLSHEQIFTIVNDAVGSYGTSIPWAVHLAPVMWERQVGGMCGLTALRMARATLGKGSSEWVSSNPANICVPTDLACTDRSNCRPGEDLARSVGGRVELHMPAPAEPPPSDASVLSVALERGYSFDGEVFDIHHLAILAAEVCGMEAWVVVADEAGFVDDGARNRESDHASASGRLTTKETTSDAASCGTHGCDLFGNGLAQWLAKGGLVAVPYDAEVNSSAPVLKGGRSAHYALITGFAFSVVASCDHVTNPGAVSAEAVSTAKGESSTFVVDRPAEAGPALAEPGDAEQRPPLQEPNFGSERLLLVMVHGRSRRPLVVSPAELRASNAQLQTLKETNVRTKWVVPEGGMRIAKRVVLLAPASR